MLVKRLKIKLSEVQLPIPTHEIKAAVSHARTRDRVASASLEEGWGLAEKTVDADPLQTQSRHFEALIEICKEVVGLARLQAGRTIAVVDHGNRVASVIVVGVSR